MEFKKKVYVCFLAEITILIILFYCGFECADPIILPYGFRDMSYLLIIYNDKTYTASKKSIFF